MYMDTKKINNEHLESSTVSVDEWDALTMDLSRADLASLLGVTVHAISSYRARERVPYRQLYKLGKMYISKFRPDESDMGHKVVLKMLRREKILDKTIKLGKSPTAYIFFAEPKEPNKERVASLEAFTVEELLDELRRRHLGGKLVPSPNVKVESTKNGL
jgi:hypothetical protein